jgi:hypothetical protein
MGQITYDEVVKLVDQLSPTEQQSLIAYLQSLAKRQSLNKEEWKALLKASVLSIPAGEPFSDRREDWYDEDGR